MEILAYGENALLIRFPQQIALEIHRKVKTLTELVEKLKGVQYSIPAYCSLTVVFDPKLTSYTNLKEEIQQMDLNNHSDSVKGRHFKIPVCYEEAYAPDISELSELKKLSTEEIIRLHTSVRYHIYMMGFIPGFPYLGKIPEQLSCKRKDIPRKQVVKGSVGLAGLQTGIYPSEAPGGWQLIGRTPVPFFQAKEENPFLTQMGDVVTFYSISDEEFKSIENKFIKGEIKGEDFYA